MTNCCEDFIGFLNYGNRLSIGGGSVNLRELFVQTCGPRSVAAVSFLRKRLEQGTTNKVYAGLVLEISINVEAPCENLPVAN